MSELARIRSVVVCDDDPADTFLSKLILERSGRFESVDTIDCADRLLEQLGADQAPSLILLDINMPRMSGFEFLEHFEAATSHGASNPAIVVLTSSADLVDQQRADTFSSVVDYVTKPLTVERANHIADRLLGGK